MGWRAATIAAEMAIAAAAAAGVTCARSQTAAALHSFIHSLAAWKAVLYAWPCQAVASSSFPFWISNKCPENG